jgi:hypothetical protein
MSKKTTRNTKATLDPELTTRGNEQQTNMTTSSAEDLQRQIDDLKNEVAQNSSSIANNVEEIRQAKRLAQKERLDRELQQAEGKFRVLGYQYELKVFAGRENSQRRRFVKQMVRVVFVNQELMTEQEWDQPGLITDCKPAGAWRDNGPLEVTFGDNILWHNIRDKLVGKNFNIKIRVALPLILHHMYDDALRYRAKLREEDPTRTLFVEAKHYQEPYVFLWEKKKKPGEKSDKIRVPVKWSKEEFKDPVANHGTFKPEVYRRPSSGASQTSAKRGGGGGGNRGGNRGGRGGGRGNQGRTDSQGEQQDMDTGGGGTD